MKGRGMCHPKLGLFGIQIFGAEGNQDPTDSGKAFTSPLIALKNLERESVPARELFPEITFYT